jgi:hypothetical protein
LLGGIKPFMLPETSRNTLTRPIVVLAAGAVGFSLPAVLAVDFVSAFCSLRLLQAEIESNKKHAMAAGSFICKRVEGWVM